MAAESEQADESGVLSTPDSSPATADADKASNADAPDALTGEADASDASGTPDDAPAPDVSEASEESDRSDDEEIRPEDVREGVVDLVAYAVGALGLILLGYFTQRDVLTWTRGPFTVVVIIMAVHWVGRRVQARREKVGGAR
ncbi:hypothetical protein OG216_15360 [Streptomycetaceae bacterium NBC_01309]